MSLGAEAIVEEVTVVFHELHELSILAFAFGHVSHCRASVGRILTELRQLEDDVEGVAQRLIESGTCGQIEMSHRSLVEVSFGDGDHVVAADDCAFGETMLGANLHFGWDSPNGSSDRSAGDSVEERDRRVAGKYADGTPARRWSQIRPDDVVARYHSAAVSAARRREVSSRSGSGGYFV